MVCVIHGLFNDLSCPSCRENAFKKAASGIRPDAIEAAALRADERARRGLPEYIEICANCGLEGRNGERKTMTCIFPAHRQHDYRKYVPDVTAELDRAYTTGAALVVERDALRAEIAETRTFLAEFERAGPTLPYAVVALLSQRTSLQTELRDAIEHLDEFASLGLSAGIKAMRLALIGARAHAAAVQAKLTALSMPITMPALTEAQYQALRDKAVARAEKAEVELARITREADAANRVVAAQYLDEKRLREEMAEQQRQYTENLAGREQQHQAELQRLEGTLAEQARALELLTEACKTAKADHEMALAGVANRVLTECRSRLPLDVPDSCLNGIDLEAIIMAAIERATR